jgi:peroxiredoxin
VAHVPREAPGRSGNGRSQVTRPLRAAVLGALFVSSLAACGTETATGAGAKTSSASASDFTTRDIGGKTVRLSDHLGKEVIFIDFWATYCEPCRAEFPHIQKMYDAHKSNGFVVLAISMDGPETIATVPQIAGSYNVTFPVLLDEDSSIASMYNPKKSAPLSILIDKTGKIVRVREGYNPGDEKLVEDDVVKLLAGQTL